MFTNLLGKENISEVKRTKYQSECHKTFQRNNTHAFPAGWCYDECVDLNTLDEIISPYIP